MIRVKATRLRTLQSQPMMIDVQSQKTRLLKRLRELDHRLVEIEHDLDQTPDPDVEERAVEREGDEVLERLGEAGLVEIRQIQAALKRIRDGEYGYCVSCGREIHAKRLATLPHAALCRFCAR